MVLHQTNKEIHKRILWKSSTMNRNGNLDLAIKMMNLNELLDLDLKVLILYLIKQ